MNDTTSTVPVIDDQAASKEALQDKLGDAMTPGFVAELDPDEATKAGAFEEDALTEDDALESTADSSN